MLGRGCSGVLLGVVAGAVAVLERAKGVQKIKRGGTPGGESDESKTQEDRKGMFSQLYSPCRGAKVGQEGKGRSL